MVGNFRHRGRYACCGSILRRAWLLADEVLAGLFRSIRQMVVIRCCALREVGNLGALLAQSMPLWPIRKLHGIQAASLRLVLCFAVYSPCVSCWESACLLLNFDVPQMAQYYKLYSSYSAGRTYSLLSTRLYLLPLLHLHCICKLILVLVLSCLHVSMTSAINAIYKIRDASPSLCLAAEV